MIDFSKVGISIDFPSLRILVIGGNGYFGSKLVQALLNQGCERVSVLDLAPKSLFHDNQRVQYIRGDICDEEVVKRACEGIEVICHTASHFGDPPFGSFGKGEKEWRVNVIGTRVVLQVAKSSGVKYFIYISSSSAVFSGEKPLYNASEEVSYPTSHIDHYGKAKEVAEKEVKLANDLKNNFLTLVLRPNGIYGEDELLHIPRIVSTCQKIGGMYLFKFNSSHRSDWTFVDNLIYAFFLALQQFEQKKDLISGNVYNITDGEALGYTDFFSPILEASGIKVFPILYLPFFLLYFFAFISEWFCFYTKPYFGLRPPLTRIETLKMGISHYFDISKAKKDLGYKPLISTAEGIKRTSAFFEDYYQTSKRN